MAVLDDRCLCRGREKVIHKGGRLWVALRVVAETLVEDASDSLEGSSAIWPSTTFGLIIGPQSSLTM